MQSFESAHGAFSCSWKAPALGPSGGETRDGWSAHAQLLPFLEKLHLYDDIDFRQGYGSAMTVDANGADVPLSAVRVGPYVCPAELGDRPRLTDGQPQHYPLCYGVNVGLWRVYDPADRLALGSGAFQPEQGLRPGHFRDGLSKTLALAEVKAWTPYYRNAALDKPQLPLPHQICGLGGDFKSDSGHTEWIDGRAHQTGFTAAFTPNTRVICQANGRAYDVDWTNQQEGKSATAATYAAVTSRSYHPGGVNVVLMDGSTHFIDDQVELRVWQAMSTRSGQE